MSFIDDHRVSHLRRPAGPSVPSASAAGVTVETGPGGSIVHRIQHTDVGNRPSPQEHLAELEARYRFHFSD